MATIRIFDKLSGDLLETHEGVRNLKEWIKETVPNYKESLRPPYSAELNGRVWPYDRHDRTLLDSDIVALTIEPQGGSAILWVITIASAAYSYYVASNLPDFQDSTSSGKSIYSPDARANSIIPSGIIREVAGNIQIFPDVLALHRRYENENEYLYLLLSMGRGNFSVESSNVYIANTPIASYDGETSVQIFEPGTTVSANRASDNWYTTPEVDSQDLSVKTKDSIIAGNGWTFDFSGSTITSYFNATATAFPFSVGDVIFINNNVSANVGVTCIVDSISGASSEIATCNEISVINTPSQGFNYIQFVEGGAITFSSETGVATGITEYGDTLQFYGPYRATPEGESARYFELDVFFPGGLATFSASGSPTSRTAAVNIQYREIGTSTWTINDINDSTFSAATTNQLGYTVEIDTGAAAEYEFRFSTGAITGGSAQYVESKEIKRLKAKLTAPSSYPGITTIALSVAGNSSFSRAAENKINIRDATRKLPTVAELQSGTWDLSDSVTKVDGDWEIPNSTFLTSEDYTNLGIYPELTTPTFMGVAFSQDGLHMITYDNDAVKFFDLDVAYRPSLGSTFTGYKLFTGTAGAGGISRYNSFGDYTIRLLEDGSSNARLEEVTLGTAYDGSTAVSGNTFTASTEIVGTVEGFDISEDGKTVLLADSTEQTIHQYSTAVGFDMSGVSYDSITFDCSSILGDNTADSTKDLKSISTGDYTGTTPNRIYLMRRDGVIFPCTMSTPGDITTITYDGASFNPNIDGTAMHLVVYADYLYVSSVASGVGFVNTYLIPESTDTRASRSAMRFIGLMLREALGTDASTMVDWTQLGTIDTTLGSRGDYLDAEFIDESTLWDMIKVACGAVMCEPTVKEGKFYPKRLTDGLTQDHLYTPDIMLNEGLQIDHEFYDAQEPDGIDVEYFNTTTNSMEVVECRLSGDSGLRPKRMQVIGVTDETRAWRIGMRERYRMALKPATYTFTTEMDALNSEYGDIIGIASDVFSSQYGEITAVSGSDITLDFEPDFSAGGTHYAAFRDQEGGFSGLYTVVAGPSSNQITLSSPTTLDFTPVTDGSQDPSFMSFGPANVWGKNGIIRNISPNDEMSVTVTAEEYLEEVYQDDDNSPS